MAIVLSVLMVYLIFASIMCAVQAASQGGSANSTMLFSVVITYGCLYFANIFVIGLTYNISVYFFASVLAFDPWHMITSFLPYMLLSPTYVNILSM